MKAAMRGRARGPRGVTEGRGSPLLLGGELSPLLPPPGGHEGGHARADEGAEEAVAAPPLVAHKQHGLAEQHCGVGVVVKALSEGLCVQLGPLPRFVLPLQQSNLQPRPTNM
eukprot:1194380-Prorocentrum_minimum.AAC.3